MRYEKPVVVAVAAVKAIQGTQGRTKGMGIALDEINPKLAHTIGAYESDE